MVTGCTNDESFDKLVGTNGNGIIVLQERNSDLPKSNPDPSGSFRKKMK